MVLDKKETIVAYRCPHCGAGIMSMVGVFSLSGDLLRLKCDCGESELTIQYMRDGKIKLYVPCLFCPNPHTYTVSDSVFFGRELFTLGCPYTGIDIVFVGGRGEVGLALTKSEKELLELLGDVTLDEINEVKGKHPSDKGQHPADKGQHPADKGQHPADKGQHPADPEIFDIINFVVRDLEEEGKISCRCEDGCGDYHVKVDEESVKITCSECGASKVFPINSTISALSFLETDFIRLT
ncbi:MAG: hypothetical protein LUI61_02420 [Firmicutes bacterium]|nr:hypothetical protein [Bacillota bacterium]